MWNITQTYSFSKYTVSISIITVEQRHFFGRDTIWILKCCYIQIHCHQIVAINIVRFLIFMAFSIAIYLRKKTCCATWIFFLENSFFIRNVLLRTLKYVTHFFLIILGKYFWRLWTVAYWSFLTSMLILSLAFKFKLSIFSF